MTAPIKSKDSEVIFPPFEVPTSIVMKHLSFTKICGLHWDSVHHLLQWGGGDAYQQPWFSKECDKVSYPEKDYLTLLVLQMKIRYFQRSITKTIIWKIALHAKSNVILFQLTACNQWRSYRRTSGAVHRCLQT